METPIITPTDLRTFWGTSKNLKEDRVDPITLRAQQRYLKPLLGDALYFDFITNIETPPYVDFFNGTSYEYQGHTIFYSGVKSLLCAFTYSLFIAENPIHITRAGNKNKQSEESTEIDAATTNIKSNQAKSEAVRLQIEVEQYLEANRVDFPLWGKGLISGEKAQGGFTFAKVPRSIQR